MRRSTGNSRFWRCWRRRADRRAQDDSFDLTAGGNDSAVGGAGDDIFILGAAFTTDDHIDGGAGNNDTLQLNGTYTIALSGSVLSNVETVELAAGHDYSFTFTDDLVVANGQSLTFDGSALGSSDKLTVDTTNETDGGFHFLGGAGDDEFTITSLAVLNASTIDGGADVTFFHDVVLLNGDFPGGVALSAAIMTNIETLRFGVGHSYNVTTVDNLAPREASTSTASISVRATAWSSTAPLRRTAASISGAAKATTR
ncbi:MAG: hypothetical protein R3D30_03950 [Hyphomicrobiales bacterium]